MTDYDKQLAKMQADKEEIVKNAFDNLMAAAIKRCDDLKAKMKDPENSPEYQIMIIDVLTEAEACLKEAVTEFKQGNYELAVSGLKQAFKSLDTMSSGI